MLRRVRVAGLSALGAGAFVVACATVAGAHVTVSPSSIPKGTSDVVLTFRVPNESTSATVTGLKVQFPLAHPIVVVNPEAGSGWQVSTKQKTLAKPVTTDDGTFTSITSEVDWTGGSIPIGQFAEFNVLAQGIPSDAHQLVFKAIQVYSDGSTVAWIQVPSQAVPDPPHPAPTVTLTASGSTTNTTITVAGANASGTTATNGGSSSNGAAIAALILAGFAVIIALLAVWLGRPRLGAGSGASAHDDDEST